MVIKESSHSWSSAHAWKACVSQGTEGSNPSLSAPKKHGQSPCFQIISAAYFSILAIAIEVLMTVSGFSEIESMPSSTRKVAKSKKSDGA